MHPVTSRSAARRSSAERCAPSSARPGTRRARSPDFPPVAERDDWDATDWKDPGDVGLLKCERGSMYDAHELVAGGTKKPETPERKFLGCGGGGVGDVVEEVCVPKNVVVSPTPDAPVGRRRGLFSPRRSDSASATAASALIQRRARRSTVRDVQLWVRDCHPRGPQSAVVCRHRRRHVSAGAKPRGDLPRAGLVLPSHPSVVDEAGNQPMCHKEICSSWCGADVTTPYDEWTAETEEEHVLGLVQGVRGGIKLEDRVAQTTARCPGGDRSALHRRWLSRTNLKVPSMSSQFSPARTTREVDFPAAMLGVRAAIAR